MYYKFRDNLNMFNNPVSILITLCVSIITPGVAFISLLQFYSLLKELKEYVSQEVFEVNQSVLELMDTRFELNKEIKQLKELHNLSSDVSTLKKEKEMLDQEVNHLRAAYNIDVSLNALGEEQSRLTKTVQGLKKQLIEEEDKILYQSFGIYKPRYSFENSELYSEKLKEITNKQKAMVKDGSAFYYESEYIIDGSAKKGNKMQQSFAKFGMTTFNLECTLAVKNVKFNNFEQMKAKIEKSYAKVNKGLESFSISIEEHYLHSKIDELHLAFEYAELKQKEKEHEQEMRRLQREEEQELKRIQKEVDAERVKLNKELNHFETALNDKREQLEVISSEEDRKIVEEELIKLEKQIEEVKEQDEHLDEKLEVRNKAGYVYIISNIGAYGEDIYKIGVTRRANPEDRVKELSGASVPFKFDTHALIFSDDAYALENALHKEFADKQVNMANNKKEFFRVTLDEIKDVVRKNYNKVVEFIDIPDAEEYRMTQRILETSREVIE